MPVGGALRGAALLFRRPMNWNLDDMPVDIEPNFSPIDLDIFPEPWDPVWLGLRMDNDGVLGVTEAHRLESGSKRTTRIFVNDPAAWKFSGWIHSTIAKIAFQSQL
jgi:hypothetical protein